MYAWICILRISTHKHILFVKQNILGVIKSSIVSFFFLQMQLGMIHLMQ